MELKQILMVVAMLGVLGAYWWFKVGRHGGSQGYVRKRLGLREGEQPTAMWMCYYDIDRTTGEKVGEVLGVRTRGINVMLALTSAGRLAIGDNEGSRPPLGFDHGQVAISETSKKAEVGSIAGPGGIEQAVVIQLMPSHGEPFRLQIARSGCDALKVWAKSAPERRAAFPGD